MIGYLRGRLIAPNLVLTSGDVGYAVHLASDYEVGEHLEVFVTTVVREQSITLYGFATAAEQALFELLMKVDGVGPAVALALLRDVGPGPLVAALRAEEAKPLTRAAGVGAAKAQKIVLMARGKVPDTLAAAFGDAAPAAVAGGPHAGIVAALTEMGFDDKAVGAVVADVTTAHPDIDEAGVLRRALIALRTAA